MENEEADRGLLRDKERKFLLEELEKGKELDLKDRIRLSVFDLSDVDPADIQKIAASQQKILTEYHYLALGQARSSYRWAIAAGGIGLGFFVMAVSLLLLADTGEGAVIPLVAGAIVEVISGVNFYVYGLASRQLAEFHGRLDATQRFLLANSVALSIESEDGREKSQQELVRAIAGL
jgi:hypothetical protein